MADRPHVGTLGEKPLHAALKRWYWQRGDGVEVPVDGYVIDLVRDDLLIEIQTRGFASMKGKLATLLDDGHSVRIVHPIAVEKWILKVDESGDVTSRRKSPKRGAVVDVFDELVSFPDFLAHPGLEIELVLVREEEVRRFDGTKGWRRHGWVVQERRLMDVVDQIMVGSPRALLGLVPAQLPAEFTTADLADVLHRPRRLAQRAAYCLRELGVIEIVDKIGNALVYHVAAPPADRRTGLHRDVDPVSSRRPVRR